MKMNLPELVILLIGIVHINFIWGLKETECDVNLCNREDSGFICETGSVILIKEVMCRTGGQNCDEIAYREVTRLCAGREICAPSDLWLIHGKYCSHYNDNTAEDGDEFLSVVFVSYVCISVAAVEGNCSDSGIDVAADTRYISSPGYPALITGSSACIWTIAAPPGYNVDVSVREYLLRDDPGKLFVKIRELAKGGLGMKFDRTAQKDLTFTMTGPIEILLFTHDSQRGHRMWIEYRLVQDTSLEHLKLFPLPNRTLCGLSALTTIPPSTEIPVLNNTSGNNTSLLTNNTKKNATVIASSDSTTSTVMQNGPHIVVEITDSPSITPANVTKTGIENKDPPNTGITIAVVVCTIGIACCLAAIWVMRKHRHHKAPGRAVNCLISDSYSLEYDRASRSSTPATTRGPHVNHSQLVGVPRQPLDMAEVMRQSEIIRQKKTLRFSDDIEKVAIESSDIDDFQPIDFKKYIIAESATDEIAQCPDIENHV